MFIGDPAVHRRYAMKENARLGFWNRCQARLEDTMNR
jgi:hypothetical protein